MNLVRKSAMLWAAALVLVWSTVGCGPSRPDTVKVSGNVTLDGEPVEGATVALIPSDGSQPARGVTDASGEFTLTTFEAGDGAIPGQYTATVTKIDESAAAAAEEASGEMDTPTDTEDPMASAKHLLPMKYSSPSTSGLTVEVEKGMAPLALELSSG